MTPKEIGIELTAITTAHDDGVDDECIAPLRTTREALTENLLAFQGEGK